MTLRQIAVITAAALVCGGLALMLSRDPSQQPAAAGVGDRLTPALAAEGGAVDRVVITTAGATATAVKGQDGQWTVPELAGYPAKADQLREILLGLQRLAAAEAKTARPENHAALEVEAPDLPKAKSRRIAAYAGDRVLADLIIGKTGPSLGGDRPTVYVRRPAEPQVWLAEGRVNLPTGATGLVDRSILNIRQERIREVELRPGQKDSYRVVRAAWGDRNLALPVMPAGKKLKSEGAANTLAFALEFLDFEQVAPRAAAAVVAAAPVLGIWRSFDGYTVTVRQLEDAGQSYAVFDLTYTAPTAPLPEGSTGAPLSEEAQLRTPERAAAEVKAINERLQRWMYGLPGFKLDRLRTPLTELLEPVDPSG